ncbi:MAG: site-specific DNA-methyltransferase [Bacteroidaceae bacterium]|nr:site-specific DNA-methyltransferase [Bacteroidaceae bacterium]
MITPYYKSPSHDFNLICGDTFELLPQFNFKFDMIFADPPYFLSSGGISVQSGKVVCVDKGDWDKSMSQEDINAFNLKWLSMCREKLKDNGTIWISGTYHNIFSVANSLTQLGYKILNVITWAKTNPPPNISCRYFTYSTEFVIWARKCKKVPHYYNYELMKRINGDTQMTDVWRLPAIAPWEKTCTKHPTQKPLGLLSRIIMASTEPGAWILDPFAGSSTTGIAANLLGRRFLGIEQDEEFAKISKARREEIEDIKTFAKYRRKIPDIVKSEDTQMYCFACNEDTIERLPFLDDEPNVTNENVLMYAIGEAPRKKTEPVGRLAIGLKDGVLDNIVLNSIGYIMFHYWNNDKATLYRVSNRPRIVSEQDIPDGYLPRVSANAHNYILIEYDTSGPANIGTYNIMKVQRKGKERYMPFVAALCKLL